MWNDVVDRLQITYYDPFQLISPVPHEVMVSVDPEKSHAGLPMHVEEVHIDGMKHEAAHKAAAGEHAQTIRGALKAEPKAVLWSIAVSTAM